MHLGLYTTASSFSILEMFYFIMGISGIFKSLYVSTVFGTGMEVTSPALAVVMYMVVSLVEGVGGIAFSFLSCKYLHNVM